MTPAPEPVLPPPHPPHPPPSPPPRYLGGSSGRVGVGPGPEVLPHGVA